MIRAGFLVHMTIVATRIAAQTVFIPDLQFRDRLNEWAPGLVDVNGYMPQETLGMHPSEFYLYVNWSPANLAGIEELDGMQDIRISCMPGADLTLDSLGGTSILELMDYPNAELPGIAWVSQLTIDGAPTITDLPNLEYDLLTILTLKNLGSLTSAPAIHEGIQQLTLKNYPVAVPMPDLPSTLYSFTSQMNDHADIPDPLPEGLSSLVIGNMPNLLTLPPLPVGLGTLDLGMIPIADLDASACSISNCTLENLPNLITAHIGWGGALWVDSLLALVELDAGPGATMVSVIDAPLLTSISYGDVLESLFLQRVPALASIPGLPQSLNFLGIGGSAVEELPALPEGLYSLGLGTSPIEELGPLPESLYSVELGFLPLSTLPTLPSNLQILRLDSMDIACLPFLPAGLTVLELISTSITCMPNHPVGVGPLLPLCTVLSSSCPGSAAVVRGRAFRDDDEDGIQDAGEPGLPFSTVTSEPLGWMTGTDQLGNYEIALPIGSHVLTLSVPGTQGATITPDMHQVEPSASLMLIEDIDFAVVMDTTQFDATVFHEAEAIRPGFSTTYTVQAATFGAAMMNPQVKLLLEPWFTNVTVLDPLGTVDGDTVIWNLPSLVMGEPFEGQVLVDVPASTSLGAPVLTVATISANGNETDVESNTHTRYDEAVGSFDPNDKRVSPSVLTEAEGDGGLEVEYFIRFQNTGTFYAERVVITDTLSQDLFPPSFQLLGTSHDCDWFYRDGALHFVFDSILLPDSATNEAGSHGFVAFRVRTQPDLPPGHVVPNEANIYFDFNEPVITEPCELEVESPQAIADADLGSIRAYPVPTSGGLALSNGAPWAGGNYRLIDATGAQVQQGKISGANSHLDLSSLPQGLYVLRLEDNDRVWSQLVVKE